MRLCIAPTCIIEYAHVNTHTRTHDALARKHRHDTQTHTHTHDTHTHTRVHIRTHREHPPTHTHPHPNTPTRTHTHPRTHTLVETRRPRCKFSKVSQLLYLLYTITEKMSFKKFPRYQPAWPWTDCCHSYMINLPACLTHSWVANPE